VIYRIGYTGYVSGKNQNNFKRRTAMSLKPVLFGILATMLLLPVAQAEESPAEAAPAAEPPNLMEERVRAYREQFDKRAKDAELLRQEHQAEMDKLREERQAEMEQTREERQAEMEQTREERQAEMESMRAQRTMPEQRPMTERQQAMQKYHDEQRAIHEKQRQAREAQVTGQREARQKVQEARMDAYLKQREERLAALVKQQEKKRNRAEERHNYLVENQDDIMEGMLDEQVDIASRHEELRLQAEERRQKMAVMRTTLMDMAPEERRAYMEEQREELFGERAMPQRPARRSVPPTWTQNRMRPPAPPRY
jgi:hypothetical protein